MWGAVGRDADAPVHVVTTAVEHSAVLDACRRSRGRGDRGRRRPARPLRPDEVLAAVRPETALVTVQLANHEVGTIQPAARGRRRVPASAACSSTSTRAWRPGTSRSTSAPSAPTSCSVSAHKFGGPKGAGALLVRRGLRLPPFVVGGAQERARRGGLEDVPAMVGFGAAAAELSADDRLAAEASAPRA